MIKKEVELVKAFTKDPMQGNPAGVMLDADGLTDEQMMQISADLGFSESAFVQSSQDADYKVRFFTPTEEVDICGHATIATFHTLLKTKAIIFDELEHVTKTQESKAGILPVTCYRDGLIVMTQKNPEFFEAEKDVKRIASLLSISPSDILDHPIQTVSTGTPKLIIPVKSLDSLLAIQPDLDGIAKYCKETGARGFYPFTTETKDIDSDFHARRFNPLAGINEDPITGVAAGALGAYVVKHGVSNKKEFVVEQGYILNKSGKITIRVGDTIQVGGHAVTYATRKIEL